MGSLCKVSRTWGREGELPELVHISQLRAKVKVWLPHGIRFDMTIKTPFRAGRSLSETVEGGRRGRGRERPLCTLGTLRRAQLRTQRGKLTFRASC